MVGEQDDLRPLAQCGQHLQATGQPFLVRRDEEVVGQEWQRLVGGGVPLTAASLSERKSWSRVPSLIPSTSQRLVSWRTATNCGWRPSG